MNLDSNTVKLTSQKLKSQAGWVQQCIFLVGDVLTVFWLLLFGPDEYALKFSLGVLVFAMFFSGFQPKMFEQRVDIRILVNGIVVSVLALIEGIIQFSLDKTPIGMFLFLSLAVYLVIRMIIMRLVFYTYKYGAF